MGEYRKRARVGRVALELVDQFLSRILVIGNNFFQRLRLGISGAVEIFQQGGCLLAEFRQLPVQQFQGLLEQHGHFRRRPPLRPGQKGQLHGK